jgi:hypothetical protein
MAAFTPDVVSNRRHQLYLSCMLENGAVQISLDTFPTTKWLNIDYTERRGLLG